MPEHFNIHLALFALRFVAGVLFFFQGYDKIFNIRIDGVMNTFGPAFGQKNVSKKLFRPAITISSYAEMIFGVLLAIGFLRDISLAVLVLDMVFVSLAFSLIKPMWDMQYFFPRFVFIIALLILPKEYDVLSLDSFFK